MIEDIISEVKAAEEKSAQIVSKAVQKGKDMILQAEIEADNKRRQVVQEIKADTKKVVAEAEAKAAVAREKILVDGKKAANEMLERLSKNVDKLADEIVDNLLKKY